MCPRCESAMDVLAFGSVELDMCRSCRGLWFDRAELRSFGDATSEATLNAQVLELLRELGQRSSAAPQDAYARCPVCGTRMNRKNHAWKFPIVLHGCLKHRTWADHDEAVRFVELMGSADEAQLVELAAQQKERDLRRQFRELRFTSPTPGDRLLERDTSNRIGLIMDLFRLF